LRIVDPHHHLWDLENLHYGWLKGPNQVDIHLAGPLTPIRKTYLLADYKKDIKDQNVVKSVHLQAECEDPIAETKWLQSIAEINGLPTALVPYANLASPKLSETLDVYHTIPQVRGIRQLLNWDPVDPSLSTCDQDYLKSDAWFKGLELIGAYGYSFDLHVWYHQLAEAGVIAARVPKVQFILNHTGMPYIRDDAGYQKWRDGLSKLAANPNVAAKISGLGMTDHNWTVDSIRPYVLGTIEVFGLDRCMFASNFPVDKLLSSYNRLYDAFKEIVYDFPRADQERLFHDNAIRVYRL